MMLRGRRRKVAWAAGLVLFIGACAQTQLAVHTAKRISNRGDTPITSWVIMALTSGFKQGFTEAAGARAKAILFIRGMTQKSGLVHYDTTKNPKELNNNGTIAAALMVENYAFLHARKPYRDAQALKLLNRSPVWDRSNDRTNSPYAWYLTTTALYHRGGAEWKDWYH